MSVQPTEPLLTEGEKEKLRAEEQFRATIRQWIEDQKPKKSSWRAFGSSAWAFANSTFFLWVLSTIVVTFGTIRYAEWRQSESEERLRQQLIDRLDMEIASRLQYVADSWSDSAGTSSPGRPAFPDTRLRNLRARLLLSLMRPDSANFPIGVFPEFVPRPLPSLIWELRHALVDSAKGKLRPAFAAELDSALATSVRLFRFYAEMQRTTGLLGTSRAWEGLVLLLERDPYFQTPMVKEWAMQIHLKKGEALRNLNLERWKCPFGTKPGAPCLGFTRSTDSSRDSANGYPDRQRG